MEWSKYQNDIFAEIDTGKGNIAVKAVAGSGKTTTAIEGVSLMKGSVTMLAFNRDIAKVMGQKLSERKLTHAKSFTFHGLGYSTLRYAWRNGPEMVVADETKTGDTKWDRITAELGIPEYLVRFTYLLSGHAKKRAFGILEPIHSKEAWIRICDHHDLYSEINNEAVVKAKSTFAQAIELGLELAKAGLLRSNEISEEEHFIDMDDMVYIPVLLPINFYRVDWVVVDEAQDSNPVWRCMVRKLGKYNGRSMWIGDPRQAINGFAGADNDAFAQVIKEFNCKEMLLTVSYRSSKASVEFVKQWVPYIEAHEGNLPGSINPMDWKSFLETKFNPETDAIICRNTYPLVMAAYSLVGKGIPCQIRGRNDLGDGLIKLITKWKTPRSLQELGRKLNDYCAKQSASYEAAGKEMLAAGLNDKVNAVFAIMNNLPPRSTIADLIEAIESIFGDKENDKKRLTLCTGHKSKGLEWDNVYWIGLDAFQPSKYARQQWQVDQEINLMYVMGTRNKDAMYLVEAPPRQDVAEENKDAVLMEAR